MTASPIISAAAVALVRLGLRIVFPRASAPTRAGSRTSGQPTTAASGLASSGPITVTPAKHSPAPTAVTATPAPATSPASSRAAPAPVMIRPAASRRAENACGLGAASRSACTGATLVARYAGASAAASVVTSPMTHARATWSSGTDRPVMGSDSPNVPSSAARPRATRDAQQRAGEHPGHAHGRGLGQHRAEHLAAAGAERAEQGKLPRPLADHDGEGVPDHERADEHGDRRQRRRRTWSARPAGC